MSNGFAYSVRVKNGAGWRNFKRVRLMISVGQEYHEDQKLMAAVEWINRNPVIEEVHISVNDLLQRHNHYARGIPTSQADAIALAEGSLWIERNEETLSLIRPDKQLTRWKDWFGGHAYQSAKSAIDLLAANDTEFTTSLHEDLDLHAARRMERGEAVSEAFRTHSLEYLKEELAVFCLQTRSLPAAEVYPGSNLRAAEFFLGNPVVGELRPLTERYFTRIDFARVTKQDNELSPTVAASFKLIP